MEEDQAFHACTIGELECGFIIRMAPVASLRDLRRGVLAVMDQDVRSLADADVVIEGSTLPGIAPQFVVGDEDEGLLSLPETIPEPPLRMMEGNGLHANAVDVEGAFAERVQIMDLRLQGVEGDREETVAHLVVEGVPQPLHARGVPVNGELAGLVVDGAEKGEAKDVVPVDMGDQEVHIETTAVGDELLSQGPDACPCIDDDGSAVSEGEFEAGGVSTVDGGILSGHCDGTSRAPKLDLHTRYPVASPLPARSMTTAGRTAEIDGGGEYENVRQSHSPCQFKCLDYFEKFPAWGFGDCIADDPIAYSHQFCRGGCMCGICGVLDFRRETGTELLREMCGSFAYRGPDDEGYFSGPPVGLGHRRLSIIDLSPAGHQPMTNEDGTLRIVFNGEIYDFEQWREELIRAGHRLHSRTDTEVILHLYEEKGFECLRHLNGMFAFGLWDSGKQRLWLARDRLGIKPLYYYWDGQRFIFASEIKAILKDPSVRREIDQEALDLYLTLNYIPAPWTIFRNIRKLDPASYLIAEKGKIVVERFWDPMARDPGPISGSMEEQKRTLRTLLEESVKRRLIADVPLGAFLSGGVDSSIIVALMARNSTRPVKTFSIGYKDLPSFDETGYAREVAQFNGTEHHEFKLDHRDILEAFPRVLENMDEPFADSSSVPTYIVSRETRNHVTVALSGDGGDELFAGYRMYQGEYWSRYAGFIPPWIRNGLISPLVEWLPDSRDKPGLERVRRLKKFVRGMSLSFPERFCRWREIFPFHERRELLKSPPHEDLFLTRTSQASEAEASRFAKDRINLMLYMDVKGLLHGDMLTKVDRMSMANSLEVRVPFLDYTFVEYVFTLPGSAKLRPGRGKYVLLEAFKDLLPLSIHERPKAGFEMPIGAWLRKELRFLIDDHLRREVIERTGIFHFPAVARLIDDHMSGRRDTSWQLWNLIAFQYWYERYVA